jgi:chromosome partitioning protein
MRWVVFNQKGGVGKSTLVSNLAAVAADEGERSLVVDLDPQGCTSHYLLGPRAKAARPNLADFFEQSLSIRLFDESLRTFVHATPFEGLDVLPTQPVMETFHAKLEGRHKIYKLREALEPVTGYEHVFFDTPPALNFFTLSALIAAERVLIPFDCDDFSRRALYALLESVEEVRQDHNPRLQVAGIVVNSFQPRARLPQQLVDELTAEGLPVLKPYVSASVKVRESHQESTPLVHYAPSHKLSGELRALSATLRKKPRAPAKGAGGRTAAP